MSQKPQILRREVELDFLRGLAILLVLDYHAPFGLLLSPLVLPHFLHLAHFGWAGVSVFFVLSGFLVGGLLFKEWKVRRGVDAKRFLIRRGLKIWPQYYVFLIGTLILGDHHIRDKWGDFLNVQNYVGGGIMHTWSLAVEEHTYLILLGILVVASRREMRSRTVFLFLAACCVAVSIVRYIGAAHGSTVYFYTHDRIDGIFLGVLLSMLYHLEPSRFVRLQRWSPLWLAAMVVSIPVMALEVPWLDRWWMTALRIDGANLFAVAMFFLVYRNVGAARTWMYRMVAWIGLYSYGIYLWHFSLMKILHRWMEAHARVPGPLQWFVLVGAAVAAGWVTTRLIEFPMLRLRDRVFPRRMDTPVGTPAEVEAALGETTEGRLNEVSPAG